MAKIRRDAPAALGYRMPAEWEKHEGTLLSWPKDPETFPPHILGAVEELYARIIGELCRGERVHLLVDDAATERRVASQLRETRGVIFHRIPSTDVWLRDYGPIVVVDRSRKKAAAVKWVFNAWGSKYDDLLPDNETGMRIAQAMKLQVFEPGMVLEGGSIDTNGLGTCITTGQCLLNRNRNPSLTKEQIGQQLKAYLGFTHFIWLKEGIEGDDTDGHVDDIARFVAPGTVVAMVEDDPKDANHLPLKRNLALLQEARDQDGRRLRVVEIPMPRRIDCPERRLPASYANFYIGNEVVLVPTFNDTNDEKALSILRSLFPGRRVVGIPSEALVYGYGGIHCVTQQVPVA